MKPGRKRDGQGRSGQFMSGGYSGPFWSGRKSGCFVPEGTVRLVLQTGREEELLGAAEI